MKIILELQGWQKIEDIPSYIISKGRFEIEIYPPLNGFASRTDRPVKVMFVYRGEKTSDGVPIFQCFG